MGRGTEWKTTKGNFGGDGSVYLGKVEQCVHLNIFFETESHSLSQHGLPQPSKSWGSRCVLIS